MTEAGRSNYKKIQAKTSKKSERTQVRAVLKTLKDSPELWDEQDIVMPLRCPVINDGSTLKSQVAARWLKSQIGKPWSEVYARLCSQLGGMHSALKGAMRSVSFSPESQSGFGVSFSIAGGVVSFNFTPRRKQEKDHWLSSSISRKEAVKWLNGRRIVRRGRKYFWLEAVQFYMEISYRQGKQLSGKEYEILMKFPEAIRMQPLIDSM